MSCPTCGAFIPADAGFCRGCGTIVRGPRVRSGAPPLASGSLGAQTPIQYPPPPGYPDPPPGYPDPPPGYAALPPAPAGTQAPAPAGYAAGPYGYPPTPPYPQVNGYGPPPSPFPGTGPYGSPYPQAPYARERTRAAPVVGMHSGADFLVALFTGVVLLAFVMPWYTVRVSDSFGNSQDIGGAKPLDRGVVDGWHRAMLWLAIGVLAYLVVRMFAGRHWPLPWWSHFPALALLAMAQMAVVAGSFATLPAGGFHESYEGASVAITQTYGAYVAIIAAAAAAMAALTNRPRRGRTL